MSRFGGSATRSLSIDGPPPAAEVASPREGSGGEKGMGSFEEKGELQARARARDAVRSLRVHVPTARAWRLQVGQRADPGVRHLRRVQAPAAILTRATSRPWPLSRNSILELPPTSQSSPTAPRIRRFSRQKPQRARETPTGPRPAFEARLRVHGGSKALYPSIHASAPERGA